MKVLDIREAGAIELAAAAVHEAPIVVQLPTVFVLLAAPTSRGARQLDASKSRLAGKNYGTAIGSLDRFLAQARRDELPREFSAAESFGALTGTFIRLRFREEAFHSSAVRAGTHQGVLLDGAHRTLFRRIEDSFADAPPDPLWGGSNYGAPLCTSCNESGDPEGSIVDIDRALAFARSRRLGLVLTGPAAKGELGSYPIFGFERNAVRVHRAGPGLAAFQSRIPEPLRCW